MQFLSENHLNACQIFGRFGFKTKSEPNFGYPHIPTGKSSLMLKLSAHPYWQEQPDAEVIRTSLLARAA